MYNMNPDLESILFQDNPWLLNKEPSKEPLSLWLESHLPDPYIPRGVGASMEHRWGRTSRAHLVIGPRQAGKSTVLWAHLAKRSEPVVFIDCEQQLVRQWCSSAPLFLRDLEKLVDSSVALFFDEIQHLEEGGLFIKGLVDRRQSAPVFVTGSSSFHLGARTRESLAGRVTRSRLLPFSLSEVTSQDTGAPLIKSRKKKEAFERHVTVGGYPNAWLSEAPEPILRELVEAFVLRDASDLFKIARPETFRKLLSLLARQVGSLVNLSEWASILGVSRDTVRSYLSILEESHLVGTLQPFVGGRRSEITSRPKVYLMDNGLRSLLTRDFRPLTQRVDKGPCLENWVYTELAKSFRYTVPINYWRSTSGAEVDFVVVLGEEILAVEVKASSIRHPRLPRSTRSFIEAYRPVKVLMVNLFLDQTEVLDKTEVKWLLPWELSNEITKMIND